MNRVLNSIRTLLKNGFFHIFGGNILNKIVAFLSSVVWVRILTKEEYGVFTYAWNIYSILILANGCGLDSGALQLCSEHGTDAKYAQRICNYSAQRGLLFNCLLLIILLGIGAGAPLSIDDAGILLMLLCALPMFKILFNVAVVYLRSQRRNQDYARLSMLNTTTIFVASSLFAIHLREKGLVLGYYIGYALSIVIAAFFFKIYFGHKRVVLSSADCKSLWAISFVSMCNTGLSELLYLIDTFVLGIVTAEENILAAYKVATMIPTALVFVPVTVVTYVYPHFAEHREDRKWCLKYYKVILACMGSVNLLISILLYICSPWIITLLYGNVYIDAIPIMKLLSISYFFSGTFRIISGNLLVTQRKLKFNFYVALFSGCINILADYYFIQWWGAMGAAFATILVVLLTSAISTIYLVSIFRGNQCE